MGGDPFTPYTLTLPTPTDEEESSVSQQPSTPITSDELCGKHKHESETMNIDGFTFQGLNEMAPKISSVKSLELEANRRKRCNTYKEVLHTYDQLLTRTQNLNQAKAKLLSYMPGGWIEKAGGMQDYDVPETTTLLLVGPKGSGKSSLVNRISRVFEEDKFAPDRAQVSYNSSVGDGTYFLQEYMIPRGSTAFCLYDTRSLSDDSSDNVEMLKHWITKGVHNGELITRQSDDSSLKTRMKSKARRNDDKPVVVVTHGDLLSLPDRARIHVHLGELLGIPPAKQIFDIPDNSDPVTELTIVYMLRYSLEHADKNLPPKDWIAKKVPGFGVSPYAASAFVYFLVIIGIIIMSIKINMQMQQKRTRHASKSKVDIDWRSIRHLWLD